MENPFSEIINRLDRIESRISTFENSEPAVRSLHDKPLTTEDAAKFLSMPLSSLYKLTSKGIIGRKRGKRVYFTKGELLDYINGE